MNSELLISVIIPNRDPAEGLRKTGLPLSSMIAVLASPNDSQHDFIETAAQNNGIILRVFKDEDAAIAWLSE